jgi:hypothetical protein
LEFINREKELAFLEEKWSEKPVGTDILDELKLKAQKVQWGKKGRKDFFCLFSRKGFTPNMVKRAEEKGVILFKGNIPIN